jgi:ribosomal protein L28
MIHKTAGVLKAADVTIQGDGATLSIIVTDKKNDTSNAYSHVIGKTEETFKANLKIENLKMLPNDYEVAISKKKISRFKHTSSDLTYFVAVETDSEF